MHCAVVSDGPIDKKSKFEPNDSSDDEFEEPHQKKLMEEKAAIEHDLWEIAVYLWR